VSHHSANNHYREWGRRGGQISALDKHWSMTLKNVKDDPLYEQARAFHHSHYGRNGRGRKRGTRHEK
jgi:hypothetical protein